MVLGERQQHLAQRDAKLAHGGAVEHHPLIDQEHPVVKLHVVLLAVHRQAQRVVPAEGVARFLPLGLAHHVIGTAGVAAIRELGQAPDAALGAAVGIAEGLVQHALVALPVAVHHHGEAAHHFAAALLKNAVGADASIEIAIQLQLGALLRVVVHLGAGAAGQHSRAREQGKQDMAAGVHGVTPWGGF